MSEPAYFAAHRRAAGWIDRAAWPCAWVGAGNRPPTIEAYRLRFTSPTAETLRLIVTADERYRLFCDGRHLASGPEIGCRHRWQADAIDLPLEPGEHTLLAVVWSVGAVDGDYATDGIAHGFALGVDGPANQRLATGRAGWEYRPLPGYRFAKSHLAHWTVPDVERDAAATDWAAEAGASDRWSPVVVGSPVHHVGDVEAHPARLVEVGALPAQLHRRWSRATVRHAETLAAGADPAAQPLGSDDAALRTAVAALLADGTALTIPAGSTMRAVIDCGDYLTAWPDLTAGGAGATIGLTWMEALALQPVTGSHIDKGDRSAIAGRHVGGTGDTYRLDGEQRAYRPLFWRSGRYLIITVRSAAAAVTITGLALTEIRYPLEQEARLEVADPALMAVLPLCLRTLQVNAHDQFSDTPYYERMQYLGDCRIDCLCTYVLTGDARLAAKALRMVDAQRLPDGLTVSRTPTRNLQVIPPFSLWYVGMIHDHLHWRGGLDLVRELAPGARGVLDRFLRAQRPDGSIGFIEGWNFCDWAPGFPHGEPHGTATGSGPMNLQVLMALEWMAAIEDALGEAELAARWKRLAGALAVAIEGCFWHPQSGGWSDERGGAVRSQHAQVLAALCRSLDAGRRRQGMALIPDEPALVPASIYFRHYLIEAWAALGDGQRIAEVLEFWKALPGQGFLTLPEQPEPSRSDCHAWSSHPLFHVAASLAGIRPAAPAFARVRIAPCPGPLPGLDVRIPHPGGGWVAVTLAFASGEVHGSIELPAGIDGVLIWAGQEQVLRPGLNRIGSAGTQRARGMRPGLVSQTTA